MPLATNRAPGQIITADDINGIATEVNTKISTTDANAAYETKIGSVRLGSDTASITFSSIPQTYQHLTLVVVGRSTVAATDDALILRCNGDSSASYDFQTLSATGTTVSAGESIGTTNMGIGRVPGATALSGLTGGMVVDLLDYADSSAALDIAILSRNTNKRAAAAGGLDTRTNTGTYRGGTVTSLTVSALAGSLRSGTVATLYGVKG